MEDGTHDWIQHPLLWVVVAAVAGFTTSAHLGWVQNWELFGVDAWEFLLGILVALPVGHAASIGVLSLFREEPSEPGARRRAMWVGLLERAVFGALVVASLGWSIGGAVAWAAVKIGVNWGPRVKANGHGIRVKAMSALVATLVSLGLAVVGGLLIRTSFPS